ncbi:glycosyltransferase family 4 protein [Sphingomonas lacunae]|uniref:Glycosyltransferase family 4 protein n=1 Tax=Sphingomonas lacunae TaxID=2698828 RepID=A0A6M4AQD5_9SPHN|nr:glycosyltransferase family 4 protein [Sphingomonas lacunae]QJQ31245.1 glycosyltransferase family 4 protein [Sphingomonas lacunae]
MTRLQIVHLLDDFALGGVTKGLDVYNDPGFTDVAESRTVAIKSDAVIAPRVDADIIVTHFPPNWRRILFLLSLKARNPHASLLHVEHSYSAEWENLHVPHKARFRFMLKMAFSIVDHVVAVSHGVGEWMSRIGAVQGDRLTIIYPYSGKKGLDRVPDMKRPDDGRLIIGAYGRFHECKNFDTLIKAVRLLGEDAPVDLVLGGFGPEQDKLVELAGMARNIRFTGRVDDVAAFLAGIHVFAVPSRYEAYGQVANEAREAGRAILVSPVGGLPEQVGRGGVVADCSTPESLADAIAALHHLPLEQMGQEGRKATHGCGQERVAQWIKLFRLLVPRAGSSALIRRSPGLSTA